MVTINGVRYVLVLCGKQILAHHVDEHTTGCIRCILALCSPALPR